MAAGQDFPRPVSGVERALELGLVHLGAAGNVASLGLGVELGLGPAVAAFPFGLRLRGLALALLVLGAAAEGQ